MKNRATKFLSLALCAVVLFAAVGTSVFALATCWDVCWVCYLR